MNFEPKSRNLDTFVPDNLLAGDFPIVTTEITIEQGQNLKRGSLLGKKIEGGKWVLSATVTDDEAQTPIEDGSQFPRVILSTDIDASAADRVAVAYKTGQFNRHAVTLGAGHSIESTEDFLDQRGLYLVDAVRGDI